MISCPYVLNQVRATRFSSERKGPCNAHGSVLLKHMETSGIVWDFSFAVYACKMLRELVTKQELSLALSKLTPSNPHSLPVKYILEFQIQNRLPELKFRNFVFPWPNPTCFFVIATIDEIQMPCIFVADQSLKTMLQFFNLLVQAEPAFWHQTTPYVGPVQHEVQRFMRSYFEESVCACCEVIQGQIKGCLAYFMTPESMEKLETIQIPAPDGFYWDQLGENDLITVSETWRIRELYGLGAVQNITAAMVKNLPNVCLRTKDGHALACFEMVGFFGSLNHLYTLPNYRRRGLATAVENKLAQELIAQDLVPYKVVAPDNDLVIKSSDSCQFWTPMSSIVHWLQVKKN